MKKKSLSKEERQNEFYSGEEITWGEVLPFKALNAPENTIAVWWHWAPPTMTTTGTACILCAGDSEHPIKIYGYSFRPKEDGSAMILEIMNPRLPYHWITKFDELPKHVKEAPPEIVNRIKKILDQNSQK